MDTVDKMSKYCKENGVDDVFVVGAQRRLTMILSKRITARALDLRQNIWQQPLQSWRETAMYMKRRL